ncbi:MAG: hypothetical protein M0Z87_10385 [Actinomycetota bacterium]|nr:hypothetical protein [Actinomycetota bacterium]
MSVPAAEVRRQAEVILSSPRFRVATLPRPLAGPLRALGGMLRSALAWVHLPSLEGGGSVVAWAAVVLAAAVVLVAIAAVLRLVRQLQRGPARSPRVDRGKTGPDPAVLEERARVAEAAGDLTLAYRLRFQAGLVKLETSGGVPRARTMTSRQLSARLRDPTFDGLAAGLEQMVFAGRPATPAEVSRSVHEWRTVVDAASTESRRQPAGATAVWAASHGSTVSR